MGHKLWRSLVAATIAALAVLGNSGAAFAQDYPSRPIKLIVPWPPGQATDIAARTVAEKMGPALRQTLVVENRAGAGGVLGTEAAAKSVADGYTLLAGSSGPISISPSVQKVPYDPQKDFEPVCLLATSPYVLAVHPSLPAANVKEFIVLLRANPGKYTFATSGTGATAHLITELFNSMAGITATHVPYKGSAPAMTDLIGGHVAYAFETSAAVLPHLKAGRLKGLGVSSAKPALTMPELPTVAEALPGFDMRAWIGLLAPAGLPREVRQRLAGECQRALDAPEMVERFLALGLERTTMQGDDFGNFLKKQGERYAAIAKTASIKLD